MYSNTMPYERFSLIYGFLHFYDESVETSEGDKLKKNQASYQVSGNQIFAHDGVGENIALDETLLKMRARLGIIQFNPKKESQIWCQIL